MPSEEKVPDFVIEPEISSQSGEGGFLAASVVAWRLKHVHRPGYLRAVDTYQTGSLGKAGFRPTRVMDHSKPEK